MTTTIHETAARSERSVRKRDRRFAAPAFALGGTAAVPAADLAALLAPLPTFDEPARVQLVADPVCEALVEIDDQFNCLRAYAYAGWQNAVSVSLVRASVAQRLAMVEAKLPDGFRLGILDAWRPAALQTELYVGAYADPFLEPGFIDEPSTDAAAPAPHTTGGAIDCTLMFENRPLELGSAFDDFGPPAALAAFENEPGDVRDLRRMLYWAMREEGFIARSNEWWHYEFGTSLWAAITNEAPMYGPIEPEIDYRFRA